MTSPDQSPASTIEDAARVAMAFDERAALATLTTLELMREGRPWKIAAGDIDAAIGFLRRVLGVSR